MYIQETKGVVTTSLGMVCKRSDGTVYLKNADGFKGCASVQDFEKGQSMTLNFHLMWEIKKSVMKWNLKQTVQ